MKKNADNTDDANDVGNVGDVRDASGVGEFCLECHSSKANRNDVLKELKACLEMPKEVCRHPAIIVS